MPTLKIDVILWIRILRATLLEKQPMLAIGSSLEDAKDLYGDPDEVENDEDDEDYMVYTFDLVFHEVVVSIREDRVVGVSYWTCPDDARPRRDLTAVLVAYAEGMEWLDLSAGYSKVRSDGRRRVNFSAMPGIGVEEVDYPGVRKNQQEKLDSESSK